jgi:hypothetical protein
MAYLSGGAIFVRNSLKNNSYICGGVHIRNSYFFRNMGLRKSNGGAVTIVCELVN